MQILTIKVMRGPNYWSTYHKQLIVLKLDLEEAETILTNKIEGFAERLEHLMPSLYEHRCSEKKAGGFLERMQRGTSLAHVFEHVALEIQSMAGMPCGYGRTYTAHETGQYNIVFSYVVEEAGIYAAKAAVRLIEALKTGSDYDLREDILYLSGINRREGLGPSTQSLLTAAKKRNIPFKRLDDKSLIMLGQGVNQKLLQATTASTTSCVGVDLAGDKEATKNLLAKAYIPTPGGVTISYDDELLDAIEKIGFPLVIKPIDGNQGRGITTDIRNNEQALIAFNKAKEISFDVIVEQFITGHDFRFLVIKYKLEAVARRTPAAIIGDGKLTIQELIDRTNADPNRGNGHEKILTKIKVDAQTENILNQKNLTLESVLPHGEILFVKDTANLSTGGTATDCTEITHPYNVFLAERIARLLNLDICGIDIVTEDITQPITGKNGAVIEVNAGPGLRMHLAPSRGTPRNVGEPVIKMLYPKGAPSRIPIVAVTGTNGKTTTTRLIAHLAKHAGHNVGYTTTDGIYIMDQEVTRGDCSGPASAEQVLRDPIVDFAVLETARGGILRAGLAFDKCNISIVTNVTEDHLGLNDIHTIDELARVKSVVPRSTFADGYTILNADDDLVYAMKDDVDCNVALFSVHESNPRIIQHLENGGYAAIVEKGFFTICKGEWRIRVAKVNEIPLTLDGRASCMIKNVLPAILAASISDFDIKVIRKALQTFIPGPSVTPGRMNIFKIRDFELMIDYVHNTDGFLQLKEFMKNVNSDHKVGIIGCAGDRRDDDIRFMGRNAAEMFDEIIIRHDRDGRGRTNDELTGLILEGINSIKPGMQVTVISDQLEAIEHSVARAHSGSFIVLSADKVQESLDFARTLQDKESMAHEL